MIHDIKFNIVIDPNEEDSSTFSYKDMIQRDERRWKTADKDNDGFLTKEEFADFLHPEEAEHMRDIVVKVVLSCLKFCLCTLA